MCVSFYTRSIVSNLQSFWFDMDTFRYHGHGLINYGNKDNTDIFLSRKKLGISSDRWFCD